MTTTHNHTGATARDNSRQHNGNVYNHNTNHYTIRQRRSDETLREDGRNRELLRAAAEGQTRRVEYLIQAGADRDYSDDRDGFTALHHAALSGFEDTVEVLVSTYGLDVNAPSLEHGTPLCLAALKARVNFVRLLLDARANVNAQGRSLGSPLHAACDAGDSEVARMLLRKGADACLRRNVKLGGSLIVFRAALIPHLECMYRAFAMSRDPDRRRNNNRFSAETADWADCTPLHIAVGCNAANLIAILLEAGATMEASTLRGLPDIQVPPLFYARDRECIAKLKRSGANLDRRDSEGQTYLMRVASAGSIQLLRILFSLGASMNLTSLRSGLTALDYALESVRHPCIGYLLAEGASFHRPYADQGRQLACHDYEVVLELESARRLGPTEFQRLRDILEGVDDPYGTEATRYLCCHGLDPN
ncbi:putative ankyrin repeat-containing domain superfamily [Septoria linicola]|nr:putative ankyrin repeat-containing domain superfamily [Septoria linicola]